MHYIQSLQVSEKLHYGIAAHKSRQFIFDIAAQLFTDHGEKAPELLQRFFSIRIDISDQNYDRYQNEPKTSTERCCLTCIDTSRIAKMEKQWHYF